MIRQMIPTPLLAALMLLSLSALAQARDGAPMTGAEFDAYSRGKTFYYGTDGGAYGAEEYLPDRQVRWSFLDGRCQDGHWYEDAGSICFVYDATPEPQCWAFYLEGDQLSATFRGGDDPTVLYKIRNADRPLQCMGPEVGV